MYHFGWKGLSAKVAPRHAFNTSSDRWRRFLSRSLYMDVRPPTPSNDVSLQRVGQEAILHDRRNGRAHVINESAAQIWELCDGQNTLDQIVSAFAAAYALPAADVQADVQYILAKFHELRVLE
jgi:Coenzyme PQQ synthesis protein D (PqqD)